MTDIRFAESPKQIPFFPIDWVYHQQELVLEDSAFVPVPKQQELALSIPVKMSEMVTLHSGGGVKVDTVQSQSWKQRQLLLEAASYTPDRSVGKVIIFCRHTAQGDMRPEVLEFLLGRIIAKGKQRLLKCSMSSTPQANEAGFCAWPGGLKAKY